MVSRARARGHKSEMSGQEAPVSHLLTAGGDTPRERASCYCVMDLALRSDAMRGPSFISIL